LNKDHENKALNNYLLIIQILSKAGLSFTANPENSKISVDCAGFSKYGLDNGYGYLHLKINSATLKIESDELLNHKNLPKFRLVNSSDALNSTLQEMNRNSVLLKFVLPVFYSWMPGVFIAEATLTAPHNNAMDIQLFFNYLFLMAREIAGSGDLFLQLYEQEVINRTIIVRDSQSLAA